MTQHGFWGYLMKSKQQENWAKTSCRDCKLSKFEEQNGKLSQVGCELGRLSKFEDLLTHAHDDEKETRQATAGERQGLFVRSVSSRT